MWNLSSIIIYHINRFVNLFCNIFSRFAKNPVIMPKIGLFKAYPRGFADIFKTEDVKKGERRLKFVKIQCAGNDYIFADGNEIGEENAAEVSRIITARRYSVGGDGLALIFPSETADAELRVFGADGKEMKNGIGALFCAGVYLFGRFSKKKREIRIGTSEGETKTVFCSKNGRAYRVCTEIENTKIFPYAKKLTADGREYLFRGVRAEKIYAAAFVSDVLFSSAENTSLAAAKSPLFDGTEIFGFIKAESGSEAEAAVFEKNGKRCFDSASFAAGAALLLSLKTGEKNSVTIHTLGGDFRVFFVGGGKVKIESRAETVCCGSTEIFGCKSEK